MTPECIPPNAKPDDQTSKRPDECGDVVTATKLETLGFEELVKKHEKLT